MLGADTVWPLCRGEGQAFTLADDYAVPDQAVVTAVSRPVLLGYAPERPNGRAMLVLGGGGYVALMAGREGVQVARWLNALGYHAFVLIHRFPNAEHGPSAPLDDAIEAFRQAQATGLAPDGIGIVGLSSGGHLAAAMIADYPAQWGATPPVRPEILIMGYAPISTNAKGRTLIADKPPLDPVEKQALYNALQPDLQLCTNPPPTFIVYAGSDPVVPVTNAIRFYDALRDKGASAEMHIFAQAPHGFALDTKGAPVSIWPCLCEAWLRQTGFL